MDSAGGVRGAYLMNNRELFRLICRKGGNELLGCLVDPDATRDAVLRMRIEG